MVLAGSCLFGHIDTVDLNQLKKKKKKFANFICKPKSGFRCNQCKGYVCFRCTKNIRDAIPSNLAYQDSWCSIVDGVFDNKDTALPDTIIPIEKGHCCELALPADLRKRSNVISTMQPASPKLTMARKEVANAGTKKLKRSKHDKATLHKIQKRKRNKKREKKLEINRANLHNTVRYSGCIHWAGCNILVDSPMHGSIDIHGAGDFDAMEISDSGIEQKVGHVHGVPHCVLSHATTSRLFENNVMAQSFEDLKRQNNVLQTFHTLTIKDPFRPCSSRLFKIEIITVPLKPISAEEFKGIQGTNDPTDDTIANSYIYTQEDASNTEFDATLIVASSAESIDNPLLLCRYHNLQDYSKDFGVAFFRGLQNSDIGIKCGKDFKEVNRSGGSSGLTTDPYTDRFLEFMQKYPASSPRKTIACKVIQTEFCYHVFYLSTNPKCASSSRAKQWKYCPPRKGGTFKIPPKTFLNYPFLLEFAKYKAITALLLVELLKKTECIPIAKFAAKQEIMNLNLACDLYYEIPSGVACDHVKEKVIALGYNELNRHSVVAYNCGYHVDVFDSKMPSLENKVVFSVPSEMDLGRGGSDGECFHYALLDWGHLKQTRREFLLTRKVIQSNERATQQTLDNYLNEHPNAAIIYNAARRNRPGV